MTREKMCVWDISSVSSKYISSKTLRDLPRVTFFIFGPEEKQFQISYIFVLCVARPSASSNKWCWIRVELCHIKSFSHNSSMWEFIFQIWIAFYVFFLQITGRFCESLALALSSKRVSCFIQFNAVSLPLELLLMMRRPNISLCINSRQIFENWNILQLSWYLQVRVSSDLL